MARFRQLAIEAEKRIKENKKKLRPPSLEINDLKTLPAVNNLLDTVSIYSPPDIISTPPSVASTYLAKYMQAESDISSCSMDVNHATSTRSNTSTTVIDNQDDGNIEGKYFEQDFSYDQNDANNSPEMVSPSKCVRKLSYTLDQPSPLLMAHYKHMKVTEPDDAAAGNEHEPVTEDSQSLGSSRLSMVEVDIDSTSGTYCTAAGTSSQSDTSEIRLNRNEHLQRYLQQVHCLNTEMNGIREFTASDKENPTVQNDSEKEMSPLADKSDGNYVYESRLMEQEKRLEQLRIDMQELHKRQLDELKEQQDKEFKMFFTHVFPKNRPVTDNAESSVSTVPLTLATHENDGLHSAEPCTSSQLAPPLPILWYQPPRVPETTTVNVNKAPVTVGVNLDKRKFDKVSAAVKGYLVRRLFRTEKVQAIIKTIKDTLEFAIQFHSETPIKLGRITPEDATLNERLLAQLSSACFEFHDIFITLPISERMSIIAQDRAHLQEKLLQEKIDSAKQKFVSKVDKPRVTLATQKALERRRHRAMENKSYSTSPRIIHLRGRLHSPRSVSPRVSPRDYHKMFGKKELKKDRSIREWFIASTKSRFNRRLTSAVDSDQVRAKSPVLSRSLANRTDISITRNMDKLNIRSVRRCLYGKHQPGKTRSKSAIAIKRISPKEKS